MMKLHYNFKNKNIIKRSKSLNSLSLNRLHKTRILYMRHYPSIVKKNKHFSQVNKTEEIHSQKMSPARNVKRSSSGRGKQEARKSKEWQKRKKWVENEIFHFPLEI